MKKILLVIALILLIIFPSCDGSLTEADGNTNEYIYPYLEFELSDTLTYYTATVVAGANLTAITIPGEYHTDFGSMPVMEFAGFENPKDAESVEMIILDQNVQQIKDGALDGAINLKSIKHSEEQREENKWAHLPIMKKAGYHFIGWKAGNEYIWKFVDGEYKQTTITLDLDNTEAIPVFVKLIKVDRKDATCTSDGNFEYYYCEDCGKKYQDGDGIYEIDNVSIPSLGHHFVFKEYIEPTCEKDGQKEHYHCEVCNLNYKNEDGTDFIDDITLSKVDHKRDEEYHKNDDIHWFECIWCDTELEKEEHAWDEGVIDKLPTEDEDGLKIYTCTICDHTKEEEITTHEHKLGENAVTIPATCTEASYKKGICTECRREVEIKIGDKLDHDFTLVDRIEPDCESKGVERHFNCSRCKLNFTNESATEIIEDISIPALGHEYKTVWSHNAKYHWKECNRNTEHKTNPIAHAFERIENERFIKEVANCEHGTIYYKGCECGEINLSDTFEVGDPVHKFENEDGTPYYGFDEDNHWIECRLCKIAKENTKEVHNYEKVGSDKVCTICPYEIPGVSGGFKPERVERDPRGELIQVSIDGNIYTFRIVDKNEDFPITSYEWETSGVAITGANGSTFSFEAPRKRTYSVRCVFSNEYGVSSLSFTVRGGIGN